MKTTRWNRHRFMEYVLPWLVLGILFTYTIARFIRIPYIGFRYDISGHIVELYDVEREQGQLHIGDRLQVIEETTWAEFVSNPFLVLFDGLQPGDVVPLLVQRGGETLAVDWTYPGLTFAEAAQRFNSEWWLGYVFWLNGVTIALLVRPRDIRWRLLILFNFLTAIWLITGGVSGSHVWAAYPVSRTAVWLSVPVYLHLHWVFPRSLGALPSWLVKGAYALIFVLIGLEWLQVLPSNLHQIGFIVALGGSLLLLIGRYIFRPNERRELNLFVLAILLVFIPVLIFLLAPSLGISLPFYIQGGALMAFPLIPGVYFYTLYRHQLGQLQVRTRRLVIGYVITILISAAFLILIAFALNNSPLLESTIAVGVGVSLLAAVLAISSLTPFLLLPALAGAYKSGGDELRHRLEIRANRVLAPFLFAALMGAGIVTVTIFALSFLHSPGVLIPVVGVLCALMAGFGFRPFRRFVDRHLLGISLVPELLSQQYLARIIVSLSKEELVDILRGEVLPALLIRQSALYYATDSLQKAQAATVVYTQGFAEGQLPPRYSMDDFPVPLGGDISTPLPALWEWVRVKLPLTLSGQLVGVWLLGRRDPDDLYGHAEIELLQNMANQTAIALSHIVQTDTLRTLYQMNIDRQEAERKSLAHNLHDEVLNRVTELGMYVDVSPANAQFHQSYQKVTTYLRQIISGLRPAMLTYGIAAALEELVDELNDRKNNAIVISFELPTASYRYPDNVEEHLYRITQQAAENAIRHAQARHVRIGGQLEEGMIYLFVRDDGVGLTIGESTNLPVLVDQKHFGLAHMVERAALIGGRLTIDTNLGQGTNVTITWQNDVHNP